MAERSSRVPVSFSRIHQGLEPEEFMFLLSPFFEARRGGVSVIGSARERE